MPAPSVDEGLQLLRVRLEPGERAVAVGGVHEWFRIRAELVTGVGGRGYPILVTDRRVLWMPGRDARWVASLPFAAIRSFTEVTEAHRYALILEHEPIERLMWVPAHRFLMWTWGDSEAVRHPTRTMLAFSRRTTVAAEAIAERLRTTGVPANPPIRVPKPDDSGGVAYLEA